MNLLLYTAIVLFGLIVGSFLNAVIYRLNSGESVFSGRSHCTKCDKILKWYDLIPVFSFIFLKGKCRYCNKQISWQYPLVEIATSAMFLFTAYQLISLSAYQSFNVWATLIFLWIIISGLIIIFVYDLKHYIIPDRILAALIGSSFLAELFGFWNLNFIWNLDFGIWHLGSLFSAVVTGFLFSIPFAAMYFLSKGKWMGFGDAKLAFFIGVFLGVVKGLTALFISFLAGAIIGIVLIAINKKGLKSKVPFAPFLIFGTFLSLLGGEQIISWYIELFV